MKGKFQIWNNVVEDEGFCRIEIAAFSESVRNHVKLKLLIYIISINYLIIEFYFLIFPPS